MSSSATLIHDAMFYDSDHEFVTALVPFILDGFAQGQAVAAAVTRQNISLLYDALGADAGAVSFIDRDDWYARPATTVAGWQRILADAVEGGYQRVRLIGEVGFGTDALHPTWTRYEAALNQVFAQAPAWIVCPYDTRVLPGALLDEARRTHPTVIIHSNRRYSDSYLPTDQFLRRVPEPMPPVTGQPVIAMELQDGVRAARHAVSEMLSACGWAGSDRGDDVVLAMSEIAANSIRHGSGRREFRLWRNGRTITCEVSDNGPGPEDLLIGYRPPIQALTGGRGLWIAQQLCDALAIDHRDGTTVVRFTVTMPESPIEPLNPAQLRPRVAQEGRQHR